MMGARDTLVHVLDHIGDLTEWVPFTACSVSYRSVLLGLAAQWWNHHIES